MRPNRFVLLASLLFTACGGGQPSHAGRGSDDAPDEADAGVMQESPDAGPMHANDGVPRFLDGFFPIAADFQPPILFAQWKARGVNTMIRVPHSMDVESWTAEANRQGLRMIREPRSDASKDLGEKGLLAWQWMDEPDVHRAQAADLNSFREAMKKVGPDMPVFTNFWGGAVISRTDGYCNGPGDGSNEACYPSFMGPSDWISDDIYPCNKYGCDVTVVGEALDTMRRWQKERPAFAYIETSDFDGNGTGPSARRFNAEVWEAVIHGARGVFYFAVKLASPCAKGPDGCIAEYDATPKEVAQQMTQTNALVTQLAPVLHTEVNPPGISMSAPKPLELGWRKDGNATVFIVLNTSADAQSGVRLEVSGLVPKKASVINESREARLDGAAIVDDFAPYAVHIYRVE